MGGISCVAHRFDGNGVCVTLKSCRELDYVLRGFERDLQSNQM